MSDAANGTVRRRGRIRVFRAESMAHTPFDERSRPSRILKDAGVRFVKRPGFADVVIARRVNSLKKFGGFDKPFVIWTHEPGWSIVFEPIVDIPGVRNRAHVMNAYTGGIYADEFYYFSTIKPDFDVAMRAFVAKPRKVVMLASHKAPSPIVWNGIDHDLDPYRQNLALYLQDRGFCDIYGRGWPESVKISGNSRAGKWHAAKLDILNGYAINLAFENTIIPNYVTEKLWDAIVSACLPVYHGARNGIYRIFPEGSFIEAEGKSVEELGEQILAMPKDEMIARYEVCLRAYLAIFTEDRRRVSRRACDLRTVRFLESAIGAHAVENPQRVQPTFWSRLAARLRPGSHNS